MNMSDAGNWLDQNSGGSGYPAVVFATVGAVIKGEITSTPKAVEVTNDKGGKESRLVVELRAIDGTTATKGKMAAQEPIAVGDDVTLWVKPGLLASAIRDAIGESGAKGLAEGDTLAVAFSGTKDTGKIQPAKEYQACHTPAKATVSVDSLV
jgi:hypothetical protein